MKVLVDTTTKGIMASTNAESTEHDMVDIDTTKKEAIINQYLEAYDDLDENNLIAEGLQEDNDVILKDIGATAAETTTTTTTTTTKAPTILERAGSIVSGGLGGIINSLANVGNAIGDATNPFWLPISFGRKRRDVETEGDTDVKVSNREVFKNFVLFQQRMKAMNPQKFKDIVKQVVKTVVSDETDAEPANQAEELYDELIAKQISELLLKPRYKPRRRNTPPKDISNNILDSSVSYHDL